MPTIPLYPPTPSATQPRIQSPLPQLLRTPHLGLTLLEVQGSLNIPLSKSSSHKDHVDLLEIGRLEFPLLGSKILADVAKVETEWMNKVYLYVGKSQRLAGEVKKLQKPLAIVGRRRGKASSKSSDVIEVDTDEFGEAHEEELEVMDVVRWKIFFGGRPEFV